MTPYVLIIVTFMWSGDGMSVSTSSVDFQTKETCEYAGAVIMSAANERTMKSSNWFSVESKVFCVKR